MTSKSKKPTTNDVLEELKQQVLAMELKSSHGEVRAALRDVMALIEQHQSR